MTRTSVRYSSISWTYHSAKVSLSPMVNSIASWSQESKYLRAIARAVFLPDRSWSSQFSLANRIGAASKQTTVTMGSATFAFIKSLSISKSAYTPKPIQIANT